MAAKNQVHHSSKVEHPARFLSQPKRALLVVDIQNDYFPGGLWQVSGMDAATNNAARLLEASRLSGDLIVHIRHEFTTNDAPFFKPNSIGAQIHPKVKNLNSEHVVVKHYANSYRETDLKEVLDRNGIGQVVICGAMSQNCIDAVTRASNDFGYDCIVIHDACAAPDLEFNGTHVPSKYVHAAFMAALGFAYAKTVFLISGATSGSKVPVVLTILKRYFVWPFAGKSKRPRWYFVK